MSVAYLRSRDIHLTVNVGIKEHKVPHRIPVAPYDEVVVREGKLAVYISCLGPCSEAMPCRNDITCLCIPNHQIDSGYGC